MKKRVASNQLHTSLSTDNLSRQPDAKMGLTGVVETKNMAATGQSQMLEQNQGPSRPLSQGSNFAPTKEKVSATNSSSKLPSTRGSTTTGTASATGSGTGTSKVPLSAIGSDRGNSRATSRGDYRLNEKTPLRFVYDLDGIVLPKRLLYDDFCCTRPAPCVNLSGWLVNKGLFRSIQEQCKASIQELHLQDSIGLTVPMLETLRGAPKLRLLNLTNSGIDINFQAAQILGSLTRLAELDISYCKVDITSFSIVCNTCSALKILTCQACPGLDDFCLQALAACMQRFRRLQSVDLTRNVGYGDEGYLTVLGATPKLLTRLNLSHSKNLTSLAVTALRQKMPALLYMDLSEMKLAQTCFEWITEGCYRLETLILSRCENLDDIALARFGSKLLYLQKIAVNHCTQLTDVGLCGFFDQLTASLDLKLGLGLRYVDISSNIKLGGPTIFSLAAYAAKAQSIYGKSITDLKMNGLSVVTAPALMSMWKECASIKRFDMSVELSTTVTHRKSMMPHMSDQILVEAQYHTLEEVSISGCCLVTDVGVCSLIAKCSKQLRSLDISGCGGVTDLSMYHLAQYAGGALRALNIGGCNKITNHGVIALCTDHSNRRRKMKLIRSVFEEDTKGGDTQGKYVAYSRRTGVFADGEDEEEAEEDADKAGAFMEGGCSDEANSSSNPASHTSKRKCGGLSLDVLNPFSHSAGCLELVSFEMNGCFKVTDPGIVAVCNLKKLTKLCIRNLDNVTDSPLLLLAESCLLLKTLEMNSLDMVSIDVVKALARNCYKLETLDCELCNFTAGQYTSVLSPVMPLAMPQGLRSKLEPRPRPVLEYNRFVVKMRDLRAAALVLTKFGVYCIAWVRQRKTKADRKDAIETIKRQYYGYLERRRLQHLWGTKNQRIRFANILQKWAKRCLGSKVQGWKARQLYRRDKKARLIQRVFRGHKARKRNRNKFHRLFDVYNKIGHMVHKYWVLYHARLFHKKLLKVQSIGRMFPPKLTFILTRRSFITFQIKIRNFLKRRRAVRNVMQGLIFKLEGKEVAADKIRKNWRIRMFNKTMSTFIFICAIYWRTVDDEKDWKLVKLQAWMRGSKVRLDNWRTREIPKKRARKATKIIALWRRYKARCWFLPFKAKLQHQMVCWRAWTNMCCHLRIGKITRRIQKRYKLYYFRSMRLRAALRIQATYRGYEIRKSAAQREYEILSKYVRKIQRQMKLFKGRMFRKRLMAIRHMAAWKIQRRIHCLFDGEAKRRIQSKQAVRRRKEILAEKARLLLVVRTHALERRKAEFIFIFARRVQRCFRKFALRKKKKAEALANRLKAKEEATEDIVKIKTKRFFATVLQPFATLGRQLASITSALSGTSEHVGKSDRPRLTNAILKYHTRSIVQVGIINLHLTVTEGEAKAFSLAQDMLRTSGKPYYEMIEMDIARTMRMGVYIWIMKGKGTECITELTVGAKPAGLSNAQLKSRALGAVVNYKRITYHNNLPFELRSGMSIKAGKGGFAISDIKIVLTEDEGEELELKGYTKVCDMMNFGFHSWVYTFSRVPENQDDIFRLGMLQKMEWCDQRLLKVLYTYNLANSDVYALRAIFEGMMGMDLSESLRIKDVFAHFDCPEMTQIANWIVEAIKPKRKGEFSFSEYVHVVVSYCMFGPKDIMRFLFGCSDVKSTAYLKRDQFVELIGHMTAGNQNPVVWIMQFDQFKDRKLDSIFFVGFEKFCNAYRAVLWGAEALQVAMRKKNMGEGYWTDKMSHFAQQRKDLGVILV